jgi:hypothetical protein
VLRDAGHCRRPAVYQDAQRAVLLWKKMKSSRPRPGH